MYKGKLVHFCSYGNFSYQTEDGFYILVVETNNKVNVYAEFNDIIRRVICFNTPSLKLFYNISPDEFIEKCLKHMRFLYKNDRCINTGDIDSLLIKMK